VSVARSFFFLMRVGLRALRIFPNVSKFPILLADLFEQPGKIHHNSTDWWVRIQLLVGCARDFLELSDGTDPRECCEDLLLGKCSEYSYQRWAKHFTTRGHEVTVVSFQSGDWRVRTICLSSGVSVSPLNILRFLPKFVVLSRNQPRCFACHYATSYGLAGVLAGRDPLIITAWEAMF